MKNMKGMNTIKLKEKRNTSATLGARKLRTKGISKQRLRDAFEMLDPELIDNIKNIGEWTWQVELI